MGKYSGVTKNLCFAIIKINLLKFVVGIVKEKITKKNRNLLVFKKKSGKKTHNFPLESLKTKQISFLLLFVTKFM